MRQMGSEPLPAGPVRGLNYETNPAPPCFNPYPAHTPRSVVRSPSLFHNDVQHAVKEGCAERRIAQTALH